MPELFYPLLLIDHLSRKFHAMDIEDLMIAINAEALNREQRFDMVGQSLYTVYGQIASMYYAREEIPDFPPAARLMDGGSLDDIEQDMRFIHRDQFQQQIVFTKQMLDGEMGAKLEALDDIEERVKQKNLTVLRRMFNAIDNPEARADPAYSVALKVLSTNTTYATMLSFAYLIYLVNVYNIILDEHDASELVLGSEDFQFVDGLSDDSREFLEGLDG